MKNVAMWIRPLSGRSLAALVLTSLAVFATSARAQAPQSPPINLQSEVTEIQAENGVILEQLQKLEEQQKTLLKLVDELQRRLHGRPATIGRQSPPPTQPEPVPAAQAKCRRNPPLSATLC